MPSSTTPGDAETGESKKDGTKKGISKWMLGSIIAFVVVSIVIMMVICGYAVSLLTQLPQNTDSPVVDQRPPYFNKNGPLSPIPDRVTQRPIPESDVAKVLLHPVNQDVKSGEQLTMKCEFDTKVHCTWMRRGSTVDISGRYEYIKSQDNGNRDCSFTIQTFSRIDVGEWQCVGVFDDHSTKATSTATLAQQSSDGPTDTKIVVLLEGPTDQRVDPGSQVTLKCLFSAPVECVWMRRSEHIDVMGRYNYVTKSNDPKQSDCSVTISNVKQIDVGQWACGSMGDSDSLGITSNSITISLNSS